MADDWTLSAFKEFVEVRFTLLERAVDKAEDANEKRLLGLNEFRATVETLIQTRVSQESHNALAEQVKRLQDAETKSGGKAAGISQIGAIAATAIATASAGLLIFAAISGA